MVAFWGGMWISGFGDQKNSLRRWHEVYKIPWRADGLYGTFAIQQIENIPLSLSTYNFLVHFLLSSCLDGKLYPR